MRTVSKVILGLFVLYTLCISWLYFSRVTPEFETVTIYQDTGSIKIVYVPKPVYTSPTPPEYLSDTIYKYITIIDTLSCEAIKDDYMLFRTYKAEIDTNDVEFNMTNIVSRNRILVTDITISNKRPTAILKPVEKSSVFLGMEVSSNADIALKGIYELKNNNYLSTGVGINISNINDVRGVINLGYYKKIR